jgi:hypothetical protein
MTATRGRIEIGTLVAVAMVAVAAVSLAVQLYRAIRSDVPERSLARQVSYLPDDVDRSALQAPASAVPTQPATSYDSSSAEAWERRREETPVTYTIRSAQSGQQVINPDGSFKPELVQRVPAVDRSNAPHEARPTGIETPSLMQPAASPAAFQEGLEADGDFLSSRNVHASDHYAARHVERKLR